MRKSIFFISAVLTTFALVMVYNIVSAYRTNQSISAVAATAVEPATQIPAPTDAPAPTPTVLTPQEAAQFAAQVVGNSDLLSAESSSLNGVDAYKVTFTNQDVVYVGLDGQILSVQIAPVVVNVSLPEKHKIKNHTGNTDNQNSSESHEEHED